ncbi:MAG: DUF1573 domain-containing protein [Oceanipulchritudo sp.]
MKPALTSILILFLAPLLLHAGLEWENETVDLKAGLADSRSEAVFRFTNTGEEPVTITRMTSSCGCTVPELEKRTYAPGEGGEITAVFTFGSREGRQEKRITVESRTEGETTTELLNFVTHIPRWGNLTPRLLRWGVDAEATAKEVRLRLDDPERMSEPVLKASPKAFRLEPVEAGPSEWVYRVRPVDTGSRETERIVFEVTATVDGQRHERAFAFHCLIR